MNIEEGIDPDGIVEDLDVETFYRQLDFIMLGDGYLRVIADNDGCDVEVRVPWEMIDELRKSETVGDSMPFYSQVGIENLA